MGEDLDELVLVLGLEQRLELARGQLGERLVGRGEDRDRALGGQGVLQAGGLDGLGERVERALVLGDGQDVVALGSNVSAWALSAEKDRIVAAIAAFVREILVITSTPLSCRHAYRATANPAVGSRNFSVGA
jgi:hypothetical protein